MAFEKFANFAIRWMFFEIGIFSILLVIYLYEVRQFLAVFGALLGFDCQ